MILKHVTAGAHHWPPISLVPQLAPMHHQFHWSPISLPPPPRLPISLVPFSLVPQFISPPLHYLNSLAPLLISPPIFGQSQWSPISLPPPPPPPPISLVPHLIGPFSPAGPPIHKSPPHCLNSMAPFSLVPHCNPFYPVLIGPPSHRSSSVTLVIQFSLVPRLIGSPM